MDNAADRKQINAARKASKLIDQNDAEVMVGLMSTEPGRAWVWRRLEEAGIFQTSFSDNPLVMSFREGERNRGIVLLNSVMQFCPEQFIQAMREANGRRTSAAVIDSNRAARERTRGEESGREFEDESFPDGDERTGEEGASIN